MYSLRKAPVNADIAPRAGLKAYKKYKIKEFTLIFPITL